MKKFICIALALTCTFSCKKDTLSKELEPIKDLFADDSKWYVQKYEVDGADSTEHAFPGNTNDKEVGAMAFSSKKAKDYPSSIVRNRSFEVLFYYYDINKTMKFYNGSALCSPNKDTQCSESIFMKQCGGDGWIVKSLTKDELNLTCQRDGGYNLKIRKSYLLVLSKNKYQVVPILH